MATVATSGSYDDLSNKPTIPAAQVNSDWNASSGVAQILNKPTLATVATTGAYSDLSGTPTIPDAVSGTNDGINWTSLTVGSDTYAIPQGGSGTSNIEVITTSATYADITAILAAGKVPVLTGIIDNRYFVANYTQSTSQSTYYYFTSIWINGTGSVTWGDVVRTFYWRVGTNNNWQNGNGVWFANGTNTLLNGAGSGNGSYNVCVGQNSWTGANKSNSIVIGYNSQNTIASSMSIDGDGNNQQRTLMLQDPDHLFFRNEKPSGSKTSLSDYANGKTLTQYLSEVLPTAPSTDGNYKLVCSVSNGVATYSWVAE